MNKQDAHKILDRVKNGEPMSIFVTTEALRSTGDICGVFDEPLCSDGDESRNDRAIEVESKGIEKGFSYSAYLDSPKDKGVKE